MTFVITTYDWVPPFAVGYVRDLRIRWACEEAGLPYRIETTSVREKTAQHFACQPFGQVPILRDGGRRLRERYATPLLAQLRDAVGLRDLGKVSIATGEAAEASLTVRVLPAFK